MLQTLVSLPTFDISAATNINWTSTSNGRKSSRINTTLAVNGLTPLLIARLDHQDAIARLNLLKLIKVRDICFCEYSIINMAVGFIEDY